jgi:hypothetical protein
MVAIHPVVVVSAPIVVLVAVVISVAVGHILLQDLG